VTPTVSAFSPADLPTATAFSSTDSPLTILPPEFDFANQPTSAEITPGGELDSLPEIPESGTMELLIELLTIFN
jgi:hypothetical protein